MNARPNLLAKFRLTLCILVLLAASTAALASEYHGVVTFGGLPVPGATVTVTQGGRKYVTVTDTQGFYSFPTLADGAATVDIEMTGFEALKQDVTVAADAPLGKLELRLLTLDAMLAALKPVASAPFTETQTRIEPRKTAETPKPAANQPAPPPQTEETTSRANDGLLVNGSVNNAATSQFSLAPRFGNTASGKSLYSYGLYVRVENSALDAQSYSLTGFQSPKPQESQVTGGITFQGPIKIPHILRNGPNIFLQYQRTENSVASTSAGTGLVPDSFERIGNFAHETNVPTLIAPSDISTACKSAGITPGVAFAGNIIPTACISPQAQALINLYPLPNFAGNTIYNYQVPLVTDVHQDVVNSNVSKTVGRKNQINGNFGLQNTRTSFQDLFGFTDSTSGLGLNANISWNHTYNAHTRTSLSYTFSHQSNRTTPYWQTHQSPTVLAGADQNFPFAGPPTLEFTSGIAALSDSNATFTRGEANQLGYIYHWNHFSHNVTGGADFNRREFNYLSQSNPRGALTFSAANPITSGYDLADFLLGNPYTSQINYGNADKYLRQNVYDAYVTDDWRVNPTLTLNIGARWEYGAPVTETKNRLANLSVGSGYTSIASVLYPQQQLQPDRSGFEPRLALSWRPIPGSSTVVSAGYGITYDTSVYQGIALNLAQQPPLLTALQNTQYSAACPLTLATAFTLCPSAATFGIDPGFRVGYVQTWNLKVQRDLPGSLQMVATYLGNKGTRGVQLFLPNTTNPVPGASSCLAALPCGFEYLTSTGDSTRESGQFQLRRRLKSGFTASALYTYSKSLDDDSALGGQGAALLNSASIAQNWRNLSGERGLSTFDQRHLLNANLQYTTGMGMGGGSLLAGWRGRAYKEWTFLTQINAGSGNPITPLASSIGIAGYTSLVRPNLTGAPLYLGGRVNPAAYATPVGQFGNARRDSITGPNQFTLSATMQRTFRITTRYNLDAQIFANNALNHVTFATYYNNINSSQFGLPTSPNTMRTMQAQLRLRF